MKLAGGTYGSDPELFVEKNGEVIGSEKAIPKAGLFPVVYSYYTKPSVVLDGVQLELHPTYALNPQGGTTNLSNIFRVLKAHLDKTPEIKACFKPVIEVSEKELASLSDDTRVLGCQPSRNYYGLRMPNVDPVKYRKRSAGGHVHFGVGSPIYNSSSGKDYRTRLVPICDALLGTVGVLLDMDPDQKERRKLYGMAGEYRLPIYGLEYRTLSNFWLRSVPLYQLIMGLAQQAVAILTTTLLTEQKEDIEIELLDKLDFKKVVRSIQTNDYDMARANFELIKPFILKHFTSDNAPIHNLNMDKFVKFLDNVKKDGLDSYFPIDGDKVIENWLTKDKWDGKEWTQFLETVK